MASTTAELGNTPISLSHHEHQSAQAGPSRRPLIIPPESQATASTTTATAAAAQPIIAPPSRPSRRGRRKTQRTDTLQQQHAYTQHLLPEAGAIAASLPQSQQQQQSAASLPLLLSTQIAMEATPRTKLSIAHQPPPPTFSHPIVVHPHASEQTIDRLKITAADLQRARQVHELLTRARRQAQKASRSIQAGASQPSQPTLQTQSLPSTAPAKPKSPAWSSSQPRSWAQLASRHATPSAHSASNAPSVVSSSHPSSPLLNRSQQFSGGAQGPTSPGPHPRHAQNVSALAAAAVRKPFRVMLDDAGTTFRAPLTHPRGLINQGNMCFANAILQVLVYCAPFFNLFTLIGQNVPQDLANRNPLVEAVVQFLREFQPVATQYGAPAAGPHPSAQDALLPELIYNAMRHNRRFEAMLKRGHQEDAEEFLGFFLDTLHEELLSAIGRWEAKLDPVQPRTGGPVGANGVNGHRQGGGAVSNGYAHSEASASASASSRTTSVDARERRTHGGGDTEEAGEEDEEREVMRPRSPGAGEEDGWMEVGTKGRTSFTRTTSTSESPITRIFGGKLRSVLRVPGAKDSATLEPYQALQLVIDEPHVHTIEDALLNLTTPEMLTDLSGPRGTRVDGTKTVFVETLPPVLVVHLKRFYYDEVGGVGKIMKKVGYGTTLEIRDEVLSPARRAATGTASARAKRRYKLFGIVYHHGRYATGGHYTVDVLRQDGSEWIHIDDTIYYHVPAELVSSSAAESAAGTGVSTPAGKAVGSAGNGLASPAHSHASLPNGNSGPGARPPPPGTAAATAAALSGAGSTSTTLRSSPVPASSSAMGGSGGALAAAGVVNGSARRRHDGLAYLLFYRRDDLVSPRAA